MQFKDWYSSQTGPLKWTQLAIAEELGLAGITVWRWIHEGRKPDSDEIIARLTEITGGRVTILDWYPESKEALQHEVDKRLGALRRKAKTLAEQAAVLSAPEVKLKGDEE